MAVIRKFKGPNIKYCHRDPQKSTAKSRIWGTETPEPNATKFCMPGAVQDVISLPIFVKIG